MLEGLGEFGVGPGARWSAAGGAVLALGPADWEAAAVVAPSSWSVAVAAVLLGFLAGMVAETGAAEEAVEGLGLEAVVEVGEEGASVETAAVGEEAGGAATERWNAVHGEDGD